MVSVGIAQAKMKVAFVDLRTQQQKGKNLWHLLDGNDRKRVDGTP
jgi:hypothetical protein